MIAEYRLYFYLYIVNCFVYILSMSQAHSLSSTRFPSDKIITDVLPNQIKRVSAYIVIPIEAIH